MQCPKCGRRLLILADYAVHDDSLADVKLICEYDGWSASEFVSIEEFVVDRTGETIRESIKNGRCMMSGMGYDAVIPRNWIGRLTQASVKVGYQLPVEPWPEPTVPDRAEVINVYAWGDPRAKEEKAWAKKAKIAAAFIVGIAGGYAWAVFQGVLR